MGVVRTAKKPKPWQAEAIRAAGLNPWEWLVLQDDEASIVLVDRGIEQRMSVIVDKRRNTARTYRGTW